MRSLIRPNSIELGQWEKIQVISDGSGRTRTNVLRQIACECIWHQEGSCSTRGEPLVALLRHILELGPAASPFCHPECRPPPAQIPPRVTDAATLAAPASASEPVGPGFPPPRRVPTANLGTGTHKPPAAPCLSSPQVQRGQFCIPPLRPGPGDAARGEIRPDDWEQHLCVIRAQVRRVTEEEEPRSDGRPAVGRSNAICTRTCCCVACIRCGSLETGDVDRNRMNMATIRCEVTRLTFSPTAAARPPPLPRYRSNDLLFVFTSPYSTACRSPDDSPPHPGYDQARRTGLRDEAPVCCSSVLAFTCAERSCCC